MNNRYLLSLMTLLAVTMTIPVEMAAIEPEEVQQAVVQQKYLSEKNGNVELKPAWDSLTMSQKIEQSSFKSYTYPFFKAEMDLALGIANVGDLFKSHGDYDIMPFINVITFPLLVPCVTAAFVVLLPSIPLHLTEATLRLAAKEAIYRYSQLRTSSTIVSQT